MHDKELVSFASDNYSGVHPRILAAIADANGGHVGAYGNDVYTAHLQTLVKAQFGAQAEAFPVFNGTAANVIGLQALLPRWGAVICSDHAHVHQDESTAPQAVGGFKLWTVACADGKLTPEDIAREAHGFGFEHRAQPLAVSITQSTETGRVYSLEELRAICAFSHERGMAVHMDGARLANAAAALDVPLAAISAEAGVDVLSFGGTKNGLLLGECVVVLNPARVADGMKYLRKLNMQLASKMRFLSAQFIAYLQDDFFRETAAHANAMAAQLAAGLRTVADVEVVYPVEANAVFARMPAQMKERLRAAFAFYDWDEDGTVRLMCSFDTQPEHVERFVALAREAQV